MAFTFPIETYAILEKQLGQEAALNLARTVEQAATAMQQEANQLAQQKKIEVRDEMSKELASKADIVLVKSEIAAVRSELLGEIKTLRQELIAVELRLERKLTVYMVLLLAAIFLTNPDAVSFWLKIFGVMK